MSVLDNARIVLYRIHEKGLEILLVSHNMKNDPDIWNIPGVHMQKIEANSAIELEDLVDGEGNNISTIAIEADWHDIPSVRGLIKHDAKLIKSKIKQSIPQLEQGAYFTIKEAFKKVLPEEYKVLKELKDILLDRNMSINI